jgi:hypothetical protein
MTLADAQWIYMYMLSVLLAYAADNTAVAGSRHKHGCCMYIHNYIHKWLDIAHQGHHHKR